METELRRQPSTEIAVASRPGAVVLQGEPAAIERFVERTRSLMASVDKDAALTLASQAKSAVETLASPSGERNTMLFEFSPRAVELLKQHGAIPTDDGFFRSMVHDGQHIAGNLDWKAVTPGPDLVAMQTAAVTLALQASIKNLADAVERVEQKVDELIDLVRTDQVGQVVAHHRVLSPLADSVVGGGTVSTTDWNSVDDLRPEIVATVERTRLFLMKRLESAETGRTAQKRASEATKLIESEFANTLALLAAAEHNLASWHRIRISRVAAVEPEHLESTTADVDRELTEQRALDAELVDELAGFLREVSTVTGYEGLEPLARRRLVSRTEAMWETVGAFAGQRSLDRPDVEELVMPTASESLEKLKAVTLSGAKRAGAGVRKGGAGATKSVAERSRRLLRRGDGGGDAPDELPESSDDE